MTAGESTLAIVLATVTIAVVAKIFSTPVKPSTAELVGDSELSPADEPTPDEDLGDDLGEPEAVAAVTSDGFVFMPENHGVRILPPEDPADPGSQRSQTIEGLAPSTDPVVEATMASGMPASVFVRRRASPHAPGEFLSEGDYYAARTRRGSPGDGPWQVEALGRDGDYTSWSFETEDGAQAALDLLTSRVVRARDDEDSEPPDFDAARLACEATANELANMPEDEVIPEEQR